MPQRGSPSIRSEGCSAEAHLGRYRGDDNFHSHNTSLTKPLPAISGHLRRGDADAIERYRYRVNHQGRSPPAPSLQSSLARDTITPISPAPRTTTGMPPSYTRPAAGLPHYHQPPPRPAASSRPSVKFRSSPFYEIKEAITPARDLSGSYLAHIPLILAIIRG